MLNPSASPVQSITTPQDSLPGSHHDHRSSTLTAPGFLFVFVTLFLALGAINGQNNLLFWLFGFSIAALVVSGIITGSALMKVRLTAHPLEPVEMGSPLRPRYTLHNTSRLLPNFALEVIELDAPGFSKSTPENSVPGIAIHIPPRSHASALSRVMPVSRGLLDLERVRVRSRFPFGLFIKSVDFTVPRQVVIFPRALDIEQAHIERLVATDDATANPRNRRGTGLEYYALRSYQPGDPLRTISWKQSARSDTLLVTQYPEPAIDQMLLRLSHPGSDVDSKLFELGVSLVYTLLKEAPPNSQTALDIPWDSTYIHSGTGPGHIGRCAKSLAMLEHPTESSEFSSRSAGKGRPITIGFSRSFGVQSCHVYAEDYLEQINNSARAMGDSS